MIRKEVFPQPRLIGVDAWLPYLEAEPCKCYDELIWADLFDVVRGKLDICFDCVLCMDVIEHLDKKEGRVLSDWLLKQPLAYLSTPLFPFRQGAVDGNRYECHLSYYDLPELVEMGWKPIVKVQWDGTDRWMGAFKNA